MTLLSEPMHDYLTCSMSGYDRPVYQATGLDGYLSTFWLDPNGRLFRLDQSDCFDVALDDAGAVQIKTNGKHGRVQPTNFSGVVKLESPDKLNEHVLVLQNGKVV